MKGDKRPDTEPRADETAPGVRLMRTLWDIPAQRSAPEKAPADVATNIYCVPDHKQTIPRRSHRRPTR